MSVRILRGDCLVTLPTIAPKSVQTCVTSPPYYGLRDYGVDGQIGLEQTPEEYIAKLVAVFRLVRDALKDDGTLWLNLGDSYATQPAGNKTWGNGVGSNKHYQEDGIHQKVAKKYDVKPKDLLMIPARVALALQADGWYLRSEIVWHKPNPMPESVRDRPTKAHEMIYLLAKSQKYYYDADAVMEPAAYDGRKDTTVKPSDKYAGRNMVQGQQPQKLGRGIEQERWPNKMADGAPARNRRDVWTVTTKPYKGAHFATFPPDLIEPCILAGTSVKGECPQCGKAWVRVVERQGLPRNDKRTHSTENQRMGKTPAPEPVRGGNTSPIVTTLGWEPQCSCGLDPIPQTVLDPFNGSGTTGAVALKHGREYIGCELNEDYIKLTEERLAKVQIEY